VCRLNEREDGSDIQNYLAIKTGQRTVPNIFVSACIGSLAAALPFCFSDPFESIVAQISSTLAVRVYLLCFYSLGSLRYFQGMMIRKKRSRTAS